MAESSARACSRAGTTRAHAPRAPGPGMNPPRRRASTTRCGVTTTGVSRGESAGAHDVTAHATARRNPAKAAPRQARFTKRRRQVRMAGSSVHEPARYFPTAPAASSSTLQHRRPRRQTGPRVIAHLARTNEKSRERSLDRVCTLTREEVGQRLCVARPGQTAPGGSRRAGRTRVRIRVRAGSRPW